MQLWEDVQSEVLWKDGGREGLCILLTPPAVTAFKPLALELATNILWLQSCPRDLPP